ncbi:MAG: hypothetical protein HQK77_14115 [Desulfobacterales bacterium]|nr:hypothetical protein [Desulfobacterales bacterium]
MTDIRKKLSQRTVWFLLSLMCCLTWLVTHQIAEAEVIMICHKDISEQSLNVTQIADIFLGKMVTWPNGDIIVVSTLNEGDLHNEFIELYLQKTPSQYKYYWKKMVFTGTGKHPKIFKTSTELLDFVSNTKGAIGYVNESDLKDSVKQLSIQK